VDRLAYAALPGGWTHFDRVEATEEAQFMPGTRWIPARSREAPSLRAPPRARRPASEAPDGAEIGYTHVLRSCAPFYAHGPCWTHFVSVNAVLLWPGCPSAASKNGFSVDPRARRPRGRLLAWIGSIFDADDHVEGLYYGPDGTASSWMWEALRAKLDEIAAALGTEPAPPCLG
jgi:hypothetical protein